MAYYLSNSKLFPHKRQAVHINITTTTKKTDVVWKLISFFWIFFCQVVRFSFGLDSVWIRLNTRGEEILVINISTICSVYDFIMCVFFSFSHLFVFFFFFFFVFFFTRRAPRQYLKFNDSVIVSIAHTSMLIRYSTNQIDE